MCIEFFHNRVIIPTAPDGVYVAALTSRECVFPFVSSCYVPNI